MDSSGDDTLEKLRRELRTDHGHYPPIQILNTPRDRKGGEKSWRLGISKTRSAREDHFSVSSSDRGSRDAASSSKTTSRNTLDHDPQ